LEDAVRDRDPDAALQLDVRWRGIVRVNLED
jgi:hypothetical protein